MDQTPFAKFLRVLARVVALLVIGAATLFAAGFAFLMTCSAVTKQEEVTGLGLSLGLAAALAVVALVGLTLWLARRALSKGREEEL